MTGKHLTGITAFIFNDGLKQNQDSPRLTGRYNTYIFDKLCHTLPSAIGASDSLE